MHKWHIMGIKISRASFQDAPNMLDITRILCLALQNFLPHSALIMH